MIWRMKFLIDCRFLYTTKIGKNGNRKKVKFDAKVEYLSLNCF